MALSGPDTSRKQRAPATLATQTLSPGDEEVSDPFSKKGRHWLVGAARSLPVRASRCLAKQVELLDVFNDPIGIPESRMREQIQAPPNIRLLQTACGSGRDLGGRHRGGGRAGQSFSLSRTPCRLRVSPFQDQRQPVLPAQAREWEEHLSLRQGP
jgi:hypothetical protein